jgi:hypothetical protein
VFKRFISLLSFVSVLLSAACSEANAPILAADITPQASTTQDSCEYYWYPWCSEESPDPDPDAAGIYLGNFDNCFTVTNDIDQDGMEDPCEYQLAEAFSPMLSISASDYDASRESYWAVQPFTSTTYTRANIIYMLGFHWDNGNNFASVCANLGHPFCYGHPGDSEYLIETVRYNYASSHWELMHAWLSQHGSVDYREALTLEYPVKTLYYPRIFVARDKHALYHTGSACNSGAPFSSDDCTYNSDAARVDVYANRNVGSSVRSLISDSVASSYPYTGHEYFWSNVPFCGWTALTCDTQSYYSILSTWGF